MVYYSLKELEKIEKQEVNKYEDEVEEKMGVKPNQILDLLNNLQEKYSLSFIFISHDMKVIKAVSDYIIVIKDGRIVEKGTTHNIFNNSNSSYTKALLQAVI